MTHQRIYQGMKNSALASEGRRLARRRRHAGRLRGVVCVSVLHLALAASATEAPESQADTLFAEGRANLLAEKYDEACRLFAESLRLDPASGTALNLALCQQRRGKLASAWNGYRAALSLAQDEDKPRRASLARACARDIEGQLSGLVVSVPTAAKVAGLALELDGIPFPESAWGAPYPVDGGSHTLRATAKGSEGWHVDLVFADERDIKAVEVPILLIPVTASAPAPTPAVTVVAAPIADVATRGRTWPSLALGTTAAGVTLAALAVGTYYGLEARSRWNTRKQLCPETRTVCSDAAAVAGHDAERAAAVSTVSFGLGVVGASLTTLIAWHYWPHWFPAGSSARPAVSVAPDSAALSLSGAF